MGAWQARARTTTASTSTATSSSRRSPRSRRIVGLLKKWHPAVFEDLHGYYDPLMILDPSTAPHDPNYDWDLAIRNALPLAKAQKQLIRARTPVRAEIAYTDQRHISAVLGYHFVFEDYEPFYAAQTAMFYGLVAQTVETSTRSTAGVNAHYYAAWEAADYAATHRASLLRDQLARFLRAERGASQPASADVPAPLTFPFAYVIPVDPALQMSPDEARKAVRLLLRDGIRVERATAALAFRPRARRAPAQRPAPLPSRPATRPARRSRTPPAPTWCRCASLCGGWPTPSCGRGRT